MSTRSRALIALSLAALAASTLAAPVSAGSDGVTRWVDDDGRAGPGGCGGTRVARETIQDGVDAAQPGDTVRVCPGTYAEPVTIATNDITVTGVKPWKARVIPPSDPARTRPAGGGGLIAILGDDVRLQWLKVQTPNTAACFNGAGIYAAGAARVQIRSNLVQGRTDARSTVCGITTAIDMDDSTGWVSWNIVRRYWYAGISIDESTRMRVNQNSIHWSHAEFACASPACRTLPKRTLGPRPAGGPSQAGIEVFDSTGVRVQRNLVKVTDDAASEPGGGIAVYRSQIQVVGNTVDGYAYGLTAGYGSSGELDGNRLVWGSQDGILVYSNTTVTAALDPVLVIEHNFIRHFASRGVALSDATGNLVQDNDIRVQGFDCFDADIPTESTWIGEQGNDQNQPGLCIPVD